MSQEQFWCVSSINFVIVSAISIFSIIINIRTSKKVNKLNKKIGIDLSVHKEMMNAIISFILSIGYDKTNIASNISNDEALEASIKNHANFRDSYLKLLLYIEYSFTNNEIIKNIVDEEYKKYDEIFSLLESGLHDRILYYNLSKDKDNDDFDELYNIDSKKLAEYRRLLDQITTENRLENELINFIKEEAAYIKNNKI